MGLIIDSSVFITLERRQLPLDSLRDAIPEDTLALASITASEILAGIYRANTAQRRVRREVFVEHILQNVPVLPFDLAAARTHAVLWAQLTSTGQHIGDHDLIIAATAISSDYSVVTENLRHFRRVPGLEVIQPNW